ncbi:MAG TPA: hypothetical protein VE030_11040 [Burkholderiales bacterium]|nr:hypothetical protein [Burkholderiales bacterium]
MNPALGYGVCPDCGAVSHGNLTCRTCRQHMRQTAGCPADFLDQLDAANIATVAPVGPAAIRAFLKRLEGE